MLEMKKLQIILTALLVTLSIHAREGSLYDGRITVKVIELAKKGDQLVVNLIVDIGNASVESNRSLNIIPVLTNGTISKELPEIAIKGRRKNA